MIKNNLYLINNNINKICDIYGRKVDDVNIIAVSKTISSENIISAIDLGLTNFGENYIQETKEKWPILRQQFPQIKLHFIGHLQSNKAKDAVELFDYIHTLDNEKLAKEIDKAIKKLNKKIELFIQVNVGDEIQKSGIKISELQDFIKYCVHDLKLNIIGLMAIPPHQEPPAMYFALMQKLLKDSNLNKLSIGMSADYEDAIALGATHIRLGTAIFGARK